MTETLTIDDTAPSVAEKGVSPGQPGFAINFTNPGEPLSLSNIAGLYLGIRADLMKESKEKNDDGNKSMEEFVDDTVKFADAARLSGTHILKILTKNAQDHVLDFPAPTASNRPVRRYPSLNAAFSPYAKIIHQPVAVFGHEGARSLFEHILDPDALSEHLFASFVSAFSEESLKAIRDGVVAKKSGVARLHHSNFPVIYVPDGQGGDLQLTPISPLSTLEAFRNAVPLIKGEKLDVAITNQVITSQMQNISVAIGGDRRRFLGYCPTALTPSGAGLYRYAHGGRIPNIPGEELTELLDAFLGFHRARVAAQQGKEGAFHNSDMEQGSRRLARWILTIAKEWINDNNQAAEEINPDFKPAEIDMISLLLHSWNGEQGKARDIREKKREEVRQALRSIVFSRVMNEEMI